MKHYLVCILVLFLGQMSFAQEKNKNKIYSDSPFIKINSEISFRSEVKVFMNTLRAFYCADKNSFLEKYFPAEKVSTKNVGQNLTRLLKLRYIHRHNKEVDQGQIKNKCFSKVNYRQADLAIILKMEDDLKTRIGPVLKVELNKKIGDLKKIIGNNPKLLAKKEKIIYNELIQKYMTNYLLFLDNKYSHYVYN